MTKLTIEADIVTMLEFQIWSCFLVAGQKGESTRFWRNKGRKHSSSRKAISFPGSKFYTFLRWGQSYIHSLIC